MNLWDRLLPQGIQRLNLLHPAKSILTFRSPPVSMANSTTIVPPSPHQGCGYSSMKDLMCRAAHAAPGWYLGPAMNHYRCYCVKAWPTRAKGATDTLAWLPSNVSLPLPTPLERMDLTVQELTIVLTAPHADAVVTLLPAPAHEALQTLTTIFTNFAAPSQYRTAVPNTLYLQAGSNRAHSECTGPPTTT
jgi:hypothetical protein